MNCENCQIEITPIRTLQCRICGSGICMDCRNVKIINYGIESGDMDLCDTCNDIFENVSWEDVIRNKDIEISPNNELGLCMTCNEPTESICELCGQWMCDSHSHGINFEMDLEMNANFEIIQFNVCEECYEFNWKNKINENGRIYLTFSNFFYLFLRKAILQISSI